MDTLQHKVVKEPRQNARKISYIVFFVIIILSFIGANFFKTYFYGATYVVFWILTAILVLLTWAMAGQAVIKSLFCVGAGLSLMILLAQSYCAVPAISRTADNALKSLLIFSIIFIAVEFARSLYKEMKIGADKLKEINDQKWPWMVMILYAVFIGAFIWQIDAVASPIIFNLCIYK